MKILKLNCSLARLLSLMFFVTGLYAQADSLADSLAGSLALEILQPGNGTKISTDKMNVSGKATPGATIRSRKSETIAAADGSWQFDMGAPPKPGVYKIRVKASLGDASVEKSIDFEKVMPTESVAPAQPTPAITFSVREPQEDALITDSVMQVSGTAAPGSVVKIRRDSLLVDDSGNWSLEIRAPGKPGVYRLKVSSSKDGKMEKIAVSFTRGEKIAEVSTPAFRLAVFTFEAMGFSELKSGEWRGMLENLLADQQQIQLSVLDSLQHDRGKVKARECSSFECAAVLVKKNELDYAVLGKVVRKGSGYLLQLEILAGGDGGVVWEKSEKTSANKADIVPTLTAMGKELRDYLLGLGAIVPTRDILPGLAAPAEQATWASNTFDPHTMHLSGTRLPRGILKDTLKLSDSPYIISNNVVVPPGAVLVIEAGVTIYMGGEYTSINVYGQLLAKGTSEKPIRILSGRKEKNIWDWDRLSFNGNARSVLEWCQIENANYGIVVENSALTIANTIIRNNSLRGVFVKNSDVLIRDSEIRDGHIIAIQAAAYSDVRVERSVISGNRNGLSMIDLSTVRFQSSQIQDNDRGLILVDTISLSMVNSRIRDNKVGIASDHPLNIAALGGITNNETTFLPIQKEAYAELLKEPDNLMSMRSKTAEDFKAGVQSEEEDLSSSMIGNMTLDYTNHQVEMATNTTARMVDSIAPGKLFPNNRVIPNHNVMGNLYTLMEWSERSLEINATLLYDQWRSKAPSPITDASSIFLEQSRVDYNSSTQSLTLGDFVENGNEISFANRELLGGRYQLRLGKNRFDKTFFTAKVLYGEAERPLDAGDYNPDAFADTVKNGTAMAQEMILAGSMQFQTGKRDRYQLGIVRSKDRMKDVIGLRDPVDVVDTREPALESRTFFLENDWGRGKWELNQHLAVGTVDTTNTPLQRGISSWLNRYNTVNTDAIQELLISRRELGEFDDDELTAAGLDRDSMRTILSEVQELTTGYENAVADEKFLGMRWKSQNYAYQFRFELGGEKSRINGSARFVGANFYSAGSPFINQASRVYDLNYSRNFGTSYGLGLSYNLSIENAGDGNLDNLNLFGFGEGAILGILDDEEHQNKNVFSDTRPRYTHRIRFDNNYQISSKLEVDANYLFRWKTEFNSKVLAKDTTVFSDPWFSGNDTTMSENFVNYDVDRRRWENFLALPDTLATGFQEREARHEGTLALKMRFLRASHVKLGTVLKWINDYSLFKNNQHVSSLDLQDSSWKRLGYQFGQEGGFQMEYPVILTLKGKSTGNRLSSRVKWRDWVRDDESFFEWSVKDRLDFRFRKNSIKLTINASFTQRNTERTWSRNYLIDTTDGDRFDYFTRDENDNLTPVENISADAEDIVTSENYGDNYEVHRENYQKIEKEEDLSVGVTLRYNLSSQFFAEASGRYDDFARPQNLADDYQDISGGLRLFYSF